MEKVPGSQSPDDHRPTKNANAPIRDMISHQSSGSIPYCSAMASSWNVAVKLIGRIRELRGHHDCEIICRQLFKRKIKAAAER
jgi:hypothetical protein